jgi:hypothetical protein
VIKTHILESPPFQCWRDNKIERAEASIGFCLRPLPYIASSVLSEIAPALLTGAAGNIEEMEKKTLLASKCRLPANANLPRVFDPEKVSKFSVVATIMNNEVGELARLE